MKCSQCGAKLPRGAHFCRACGAPVVHDPAASPKRSKRRRGPGVLQSFVLGAAAVLVVLAAVIGALYLTGYLGNVVDAFFGRGSVSDTLRRAENVEAPAPDTRDEAASDDDTGSGDETPAAAPEQYVMTAPAGAGAVMAPGAPPLSVSDLPLDPEDIDTSAKHAELTADELESAVSAIHEKYNRILSEIAAGSYRVFMPREGVTYYYAGATLVAAVMQKGVDGTDYARSYYFDAGALIFSCFEAEDSYMLYVCGDRLIRLRYAPDVTAREHATNYDQEPDEIYQQWQELVVSEGRYLLLDAITAPAVTINNASEFLLPDSSTRYLTEDDLIGLTAGQCRLARNEIYARHGRRFADASLQRYFDACSWYEGTTDPADFSDSVFNEYERANILLILDYEKAHGFR